MSHVTCPEKPLQGQHRATADSPEAVFVDAIGAIATIAGVIEFLFVEPGAAGSFANLAGFVMPLVAGIYWIHKCVIKTEGINLCVAGIVDQLRGPHTSNIGPGLAGDVVGGLIDAAEDEVDWFPFLKEYPSFTVVVKCMYWEDIGPAGGADYVWYNQPGGDPIVTCYYDDPNLCPKLFMTTVGATIGAAVGSWAGYIAAGSLLSLCAATVICGILALVIAAIVGIFGAILGGAAGGAVGGAGQVTGGDETSPFTEGDDPGVRSSATFRPGDYVAAKGNGILAGWLGNARAIRHVSEAFWFGHNAQDTWPYTHEAADDFLVTEQPDGSIRPMEMDFCGLGLHGPTPSNDEICADFADRTIGEHDSPMTLAPGWTVTAEGDGASLRIVRSGVPSGVSKLWVSWAPVTVVFHESVASVSADVGWFGGAPVQMEAFASGASVGVAQAPAVRDAMHTLTIAATAIDEVVFTAAEGTVITTCIQKT